MKSKFKHLVVSGCSFTTNEHVPDGSDWNWANILAQDTGMTIHNLATAAAGNDHISKSIILYLEKNKLDISDTLVLAMWSGVGRIDWIVDCALANNIESSNFEYYYDDYNKLHRGGNWWNVTSKNLLSNALINYSKFQDNHSFALHTWLAMQNLSNYLTVNNFTYFFTSFINYNTLVKGDALVVPFFDVLQQLKLSIDNSHWLNLKNNEYFGDWCRENNLIAQDNFHPGLDGPQRWPREILMPLLKDMGILYE